MLYLNEHKRRPDRLSDLMPWAALVAPGVVLNKDGSFQRTFRYRGPDLDSATDEELGVLAGQVNNILKRLGAGWTIYSEAIRERCNTYRESSWPDALSLLIDEERRTAFSKAENYESTCYLTLICLTPKERQRQIAETFFEGEEGALSYRESLGAFIRETDQMGRLLETVLLELAPLNDEETLTYLHSLISPKKHPILVPSTPMYLDSVLADTPLVTGVEPRLGELRIKVVSVHGFPNASAAGILDRLHRLPVSYRWTTRFILLDKRESEIELTRYRRQWFAKRKSIVTLLKETLFQGESVNVDGDALNKAKDADVALQELGEEAVSFGFYTSAVVLSDTDEKALKTGVTEVERVFNALGFATSVEDINAVDAWLGTLPGNVRNNVRRPIIHSLNLSHLMPVSAVWGGPLEDKHLGGPPLLHTKTNGSTEFRFVNHVGDVGHTLVVGPTGAGKSVFLNLLEVQFLKYPGAQVFIFDKGGSARILTRGVGGEFFALGSESSGLSFQPLAHIDQLSERRWAHEWLVGLLTQEKATLTPSAKEELWIAIQSLSSAPKEQRTLFGLSVVLQNEDLRRALAPFTLQGPHGALLDSTEERLSEAHWQCFEMEALMENPTTVLPVLTYMFHRLEKRFGVAPTLLVLDEAWLFLDNPMFASKIREWLKVLRKANVSVVFATQSIADVMQSSIAPTIKEACQTKVFLPNPNALTEDGAGFYRSFGLNPRQVRIIGNATSKRDYYYVSPMGNRLFELSLGALALAYCGATGKERQHEAEQVFSRAGGTAQFNQDYLNQVNLPWAAEAIKELSERKEAA